jgi:hypothetical protein
MSRFFGLSLLLGSLALVACGAETQDPRAGEEEIKKGGGGLGATCGGIAGLPCNELLHCELSTQHPDATGKCAPGADIGGRCGGIAGLTCRAGLACDAANHPDAMGRCMPPLMCEAMPVCDEGDRQVPGPCSAADGCYTRSMCGTTITCKSDKVTLEGELASVVGIGGESTGFAIQNAKGVLTELVLDAKERRAFVDGRVARVHGMRTTLSGVESGSRSAVDVSALTVCPAPNATVNCMPPVQPGNLLCGADQEWAEKACPGIRFVF